MRLIGSKVHELIQENSILVNTSILAGGGAITAVITFFSAPIISRLFEPSSYGQFAVFNAIAINISIISMFGYSNAIMTPKSRSVYLKLIGTCVILLFIICFTTILFFLGFNFLGLLGKVFSKYWLAIPLIILLSGILNIVNYISIRQSEIKRNASAKTMGVTLSKISNIVYGSAIDGFFMGLVLGEILLKVSNVIFLLKRTILRTLVLSVKILDIKSFYTTLKEFKNYPLFNLPSSWIKIVILQLPVFFLSANYTSFEVGAYALSTSLLSIPLMIFGQALATSLFKKGIEIQNSNRNDLSKIVLKTTKSIIRLTIIPFAILFALGDLIVLQYLGDQWHLAGQFVQIMAFNYLASLLLFPLWSMYLVIKKEKYRLIMSAVHGSLIFIYFTVYTHLNAIDYLIGFALINSLLELLQVGHIFYMTKVKLRSFLLVLVELAMLAILLGGFFYVLRYLIDG